MPDASTDVIETENGGLSQSEAERRLAEHGPNSLPEAPLPGPHVIFVRQFLSPFIYILLIAAIVSFLLGQNPSGIFILAVLLLNAVIGTVQEHSAQKSAAALRNMVRGSASVIRDGNPQTVDIETVVPGDLVLLSSGNRIPGDVRLISSQNLTVDESLLTGESLAVTKSATAVVVDDTPALQRADRCFAGTVVTRGRGQGIVSATALETELGRIAKHVGRERVSEPPLMIRIRRFTYQVAGGIFVAILLLAALMLIQGGYNAQAMILMAIGLAVSTIPEGLPAALTVALALGMRRMARHNVIIRRLIAVEALGSCTFICSDKTGTLTVNELTIRKIVLPDGTHCDVTGEGVRPGGEVNGGSDTSRLREIATAGVLANESHLDYSGGDWVSDGDIVDVAFLVLAKKLGLSLSDLRQQEQVDLIPYESERAFSGSLNRTGDRLTLFAKGSPEKILSMCSLMETADGPQPINAAQVEPLYLDLAGAGYRVIALAHRQTPTDDSDADAHLGKMVFLGLVGMIDPVRPEAHQAIENCRSGGIEVAMITGDHPATARAIALELGLCAEDDPVVTGPQIREAENAGQDRLDAIVRPARVFARIEPTQKETIVDSLMCDGHYVAVTGDGVNDAPAMRRSNVGIAMGKRGTDVAKEAADLIITDDNFASIVDGVEQGRIVYNNIRKVIALLITTGVSALLLFFACALAGLPMPMTAVQLLWLNLVANGMQDVALAFEAREGGELKRRPRDPKEPIFERHMLEHVVVSGAVMGLLAFLTFYYLNDAGTEVGDARNLTLMLMVLFGNIHALNSRSETRSLFRIPLAANPFLVLAVPAAQLVHIGAMYMPGIGDVLELRPISFDNWAILLGVALILLAVSEVQKVLLRRRLARA